MPKLLDTINASMAIASDEVDHDWLERLCDENPTPSAAAAQARHTGIVGAPLIGLLIGFDDLGYPLVTFNGAASQQPIQARTTVTLTAEHIDRDVVLLFPGGDLRSPIITGVIQSPLKSVDEPSAGCRPNDIELNGERITLTGEKEIVLQCGAASIILTRAGKILIRGAYVVSRASGVNRIKGGSVQIN